MKRHGSNLAVDWSSEGPEPGRNLRTQVITLRIVREQIAEALATGCQAVWQALLESTPQVVGVDAVLFQIAPSSVRVDGARQWFQFCRGRLSCVARVRLLPDGDEADSVVHATVGGSGRYEVAAPGRLRLAEVRLRARPDAGPR